MRRSLCYCEPSHAQAGVVNTWKFIYTASTPLPKGTKLRFDMQTKGRGIDWEIPSTNSKKGSNSIYALQDSGKLIAVKEAESPESIAPVYDFSLPAPIAVGQNITIVVGAPQNTDPKKSGNRCQTNAQRRRSFNLYIDTTGKGNFGEPEVFTLDVRGGPLKSIRILTPSFVMRNKRFDAIVRFEDEYGNLTNNAPDDTLIELSYEHLRENLNWKLFVPETGFLTLPNLYFNEPGFYTIQLRNSHTKEIFRSCPIKCFPESQKNLFWGILHGESDKIDSTENIESCLRHMRDDNSMNFFAASPFENQEETSNEMWKVITQNLMDFDEADRFTTFTGFQWAGIPGEEGVRQIVYLKEHKQILRKKDPKYSSLKKIYKSFSPKEILAIPCFTMAKGFEYNFKDYAPEYERVAEIYNAWGSSECTKKDGNAAPILSKNKSGSNETSEGSLQKALMKNCRFGFVAGGLDDRGVYSEFYESDQEQYSPGLTAIIASEHTRNAIGEALYNRSCYATTGERIILGLFLAGVSMGSEINSAEKPGLLINRHISGYAAGTGKIKKIEIIRNDKVIKTFTPEGYHLDFSYDDMVPLEKTTIDNKDGKPPFVFYYIRLVQENGHMAWSSPIWVDHLPPVQGSKVAAKKSNKPSLYTSEEDDIEEEEDEDEELETDFDLTDEDSESED